MDPKNWDANWTKLGITYLPAHLYPKWELVEFKRLDAAAMGNVDRIRIAAQDSEGKPKYNVECYEYWPQLFPSPPVMQKTEDQSSRDKPGETEFDIGDSRINTDPNHLSWGNKMVWVEKDKNKSDLVQGLGTINAERTFFRLVFQWFEKPPAKK